MARTIARMSSRMRTGVFQIPALVRLTAGRMAMLFSAYTDPAGSNPAIMASTGLISVTIFVLDAGRTVSSA